jgi:hypothetical protein
MDVSGQLHALNQAQDAAQIHQPVTRSRFFQVLQHVPIVIPEHFQVFM